MKSQLILFFAFFCLVKIVSSNQELFKQWKKRFGKIYTTQGSGDNDPDAKYEEEKRFKIFARNLAVINDHNLKYVKNETTYQLGLNEFSDLTPIEINRLLTVKIDDQAALLVASSKEKFILNVTARKAIPNYFNWAELNYLSKPSNQFDCGSCWAFASVGAVEQVYAFKNNLNPKRLSVQQIVDCSGNANACRQGQTDKSYFYMQENGIQLDIDYPYEGRQRECRRNENRSETKISKVVGISDNKIETMKYKLATSNTITVAMAVMGDFHAYAGGIYRGDKCAEDCGYNVDEQGKKFKVNHAVLIVGYGVTRNGREYWIVKNSWGTKWGEVIN